MATDQYDREQMIAAITAAGGKVTLAARSIGCTRDTIYRYANKYATVQQAIDSARGHFDEELLDAAEAKLRSAVLNGERWAVMYTLNKKGKDRGYSERTEVKIDDWRSQAINDIRAGKIKYEVLAEHFDDNLATQLFREAGVRIQVE